MVKFNNQYVIPFKGLKDELHHFDFKVDDRFFEMFESSEIQKGDIDIDVALNKKSLLLEFEFTISGYVWTVCDRCLEEFKLVIDYQTVLYVKFGPESYEETDELYILSEHESEIDLSQFIYEFIHLSLPYKRIHPLNKKGKPTCNPEMLERLNTLSVDEDKTDTDPRWNDLKDIINNN
jgi:uncharacterized protein